MSWFDDIFKDLIKGVVKRLRLEWQKTATIIVNEAEEVCVKEAIQELNERFPGLPAPIGEDFIRKNFWKGMNYVQKKFDAEWLIDT